MHKGQKIWIKKPQEAKTPPEDLRHILHSTQPGEPADGEPTLYRRKGRFNDTEGMCKLENRLGTE